MFALIPEAAAAVDVYHYTVEIVHAKKVTERDENRKVISAHYEICAPRGTTTKEENVVDKEKAKMLARRIIQKVETTHFPNKGVFGYDGEVARLLVVCPF